MQRAAQKSLRRKHAPVALAVEPKKANSAALAPTTSTVVKDEGERLHQAMLFLISVN